MVSLLLLLCVCGRTAHEVERLKASYEQLQNSSSAERSDLQEKIYRLRNELQDSKDRMAAEQIVLGQRQSSVAGSTMLSLLVIIIIGGQL